MPRHKNVQVLISVNGWLPLYAVNNREPCIMRGDEPMEAGQRRENMQTLFLSLVQNTIYRIINTSPLVQRDVNEETQ